MATAFRKKPLLIPVPVSLMKFAAKLLGKGDVADHLFGSLQVDSSKVRGLLGWKSVITMDDQLKKQQWLIWKRLDESWSKRNFGQEGAT